MREIKFRGKRIDNGEWIDGCYVNYTDFKGNEIYLIYSQNGNPNYVDPSTVGQFAGLLDKNGKEIYEGDIISLVISSGEKTTAICKFGNVIRQIFENTVEITGFYFERDIDGKKTFPIVHNYAGKHDLELFEIIGSIHDNPELLREEIKMMSACEIYRQGNTREIFFKTVRQRLAGLFTDQPAKPDDDSQDCPDKFEPDDPTKYPHLTSDNGRYISGRSAQVIIRELKEQLNKAQVSRRAGEAMGFQGPDALNKYLKREAEITAALKELEG
jgi:uncharacterized phage protein (TIGR01671 family)